MNLLEIISKYQRILDRFGRLEANMFLTNLKLDSQTSLAIPECFDDDGFAIGNQKSFVFDTGV